MVNLKREDGSDLFIRPESVRSISSVVVEGANSVVVGRSVVWLSATSYVVKGTPAEVHAALFSPTTVAAMALAEEANQSAANVQKVLQWVALDSRDVPAYIRDLARMYILPK